MAGFSKVFPLPITGFVEAVTKRALSETLLALADEADGRAGILVRLSQATNSKDGLRGWREIYQEKVGTRAGDDWEMPELFAAEKDIRLRKRHSLDKAQISSDKDRNPDLYELGGAFIIRANIAGLGAGETKILFSASGLPDKRRADEAFGLKFMQLMGWGSGEQYTKIILISGNSLATQLLMRG